MTGQKLTSHEVRDSSRLGEHLLPLQVVSASKSVGTTNRSRPIKRNLGRKLEQKLTRSSRRNPCACGRTKDQDCAFNDATVFCHNSPLPDQFQWRGRTWFFHKRDCGHTGSCTLFKPFPPKGQRQQHRRILKVNKSWRSRLRKWTALHREVMATPVFEQCTLEQLRQVTRCEKQGHLLVDVLQKVVAAEPQHRRYLTALKLKLKKLAYTCDDLDAFALNHLGHDLIQEVQS